MVLNGHLSMSGRLTSQKQITKSMNPFNEMKNKSEWKQIGNR